MAPSTLDDALEALDATPGARPMAGGHSLIFDLKRRVRQVPLLVDLSKLEELRGVRRGPRGDLEIGSMTTITDLIANPLLRETCAAGLLADAAAAMPDTQVRNRGTIGGAVLAGTDVAAALIACDADLIVRSRSGKPRRVTVENLLGPSGRRLAPGEVITAIDIPAPAGDVTAGAYERLAEPARLSSICGVAVCASFGADGTVDICRVAVCGDARPARRVPALEETTERATGLSLEGVFDTDDVASGEYRAHLASVLVERALARARDRTA